MAFTELPPPKKTGTNPKALEASEEEKKEMNPANVRMEGRDEKHFSHLFHVLHNQGIFWNSDKLQTVLFQIGNKRIRNAPTADIL